ncbi:MAG: sigma factor-like helix-turn-helix DNA-binding protein, partial [Niallia sp.]
NNSNLKDKEKEILFLRFGFFCKKRYTLKELSQLYGISFQAIQIIEKNGGFQTENNHLSTIMQFFGRIL